MGPLSLVTLVSPNVGRIAAVNVPSRMALTYVSDLIPFLTKGTTVRVYDDNSTTSGSEADYARNFIKPWTYTVGGK